MASLQVLTILRKAGPQIVKQLPKLWPLLLESKNRERLAEVSRDLASRSPKRRLRARVELTAALAEDLARQATSDSERELAQDWTRRARNLTLRLDMPVEGREAKAAHRQAVREQLESLQGEMDEHLGS